MSAKAPAKGHASKHVHRQRKHHKAKGKHHPAAQHKPAGGTGHSVHTVAHHPKQAKPRGFAAGDVLPACALEAVAMSLRLAGQRVSDDEVAGLWEACGRRELTIEEALAAAARFGLAGVRPRFDGYEVDNLMLRRRIDITDANPAVAAASVLVDESLGLGGFRSRLEQHHGGVAAALGNARVPAVPDDPNGVRPCLARGVHLGLPAFTDHALILGVDVPGPHAVLATADGWWSWGELHSPWPCRVEEAWAVSWS